LAKLLGKTDEVTAERSKREMGRWVGMAEGNGEAIRDAVRWCESDERLKRVIGRLLVGKVWWEFDSDVSLEQ
jgi:hypothetical protein